MVGSTNSMAKRFRTINFSATEKQLLFSIVEKYKDIIGNKKTDAISVDQKNRTWEKVGREFNASCPDSRHRPLRSIKKCYRNKKMELRKSCAVEKQEIYLTGGGVPKLNSIGVVDEQLLSIVNKKTVESLPNPYDSNEGDVIKLTPMDNDEAEEEEANNLVLQQVPKWGLQQIDASMLSAPTSGPFAKKARLTVNREIPSSSRQSPTVVNTLTSSEIADNYEKLLGKRNAIADMEMQKLQNELISQKEEAIFKKEAQLLQLESLRLDIEIKKATLAKLQ